MHLRCLIGMHDAQINAIDRYTSVTPSLGSANWTVFLALARDWCMPCRARIRKRLIYHDDAAGQIRQGLLYALTRKAAPPPSLKDHGRDCKFCGWKYYYIENFAEYRGFNQIAHDRRGSGHWKSVLRLRQTVNLAAKRKTSIRVAMLRAPIGWFGSFWFVGDNKKKYNLLLFNENSLQASSCQSIVSFCDADFAGVELLLHSVPIHVGVINNINKDQKLIKVSFYWFIYYNNCLTSNIKTMKMIIKLCPFVHATK